jgi:tetratricopeptide (TPR) repeat protein
MATMLSRFLCASAMLLSSGIAVLAQASGGSAADLVRQARDLSRQGKYDEAIPLYRQAVQAAPDSFDAQLGLGTALDLNGQYPEARQHLSKAIDVANEQQKPQALRSMAMSYAFEGKADEASKYERQVYDARLAAEDYTGAAEIANELARLYLESGDLDNAYQWYKTGHQTALRKAQLSPAEKDLWNFRWEHAQARIAARRGTRAEAEKHIQAAKAILDKGTNPEQQRFYPYLVGYVALYTGDYKKALAELQQADQRDPFILNLIAQAYEKMGDKAQAIEYYQRVLASTAHNPTNAFARPIAKQKLAMR